MFQTSVFHIQERDGVCFLTVPAFEETGLVRHAFSTRVGGVSRGRYARMNLSFGNGDRPEDARENFRRFFAAVGSDETRAVLSRQEHTDHIRTVTAADAGKGIVRERDYTAVDGMITNLPRLPLVTLYADCVPLLFLDPVKRAVASVHSGWRGTVRQIGRRAVEAMQTEYGSDPADILAAILPCIGSCCYEVDQPVYHAFSEVDCINAADVLTPAGIPGRYMLDLPKANQQILLAAGITEGHLTVSDVCTCCNADTLHSHRATGGMRGNLAAMIELK